MGYSPIGSLADKAKTLAGGLRPYRRSRQDRLAEPLSLPRLHAVVSANAYETPAMDELQQRGSPSAATDAGLLLLVQSGCQD